MTNSGILPFDNAAADQTPSHWACFFVHWPSLPTICIELKCQKKTFESILPSKFGRLKFTARYFSVFYQSFLFVSKAGLRVH